ncbi:MAG: lysophospholipid acyltransferase family protein [Bacteroidales bacterium]|jgi:1-acyl-sn-glycerol-3-phosphate acyltransferase|nr:lysophospholipid acyltransferase family protein [Bacteroidales bacterium]
MKIIYSILVWIFIFLSVIILVPLFISIWLLTVFFDKKLFLLYLFSCYWGSLYTLLNPLWKVKIIGREKISLKKTNLFVVNHRSYEDAIVLYRVLKPFRWVSKAENFSIPIFGWFMTLRRDIKLKRGTSSGVKKMFIDAKNTLLEDISLIIFPEGTRSKTGELGKFKQGAFRIAIETGTPVIPIVITGTKGDLFNKYGILKGKHTVEIKILDEVSVENYSDSNINELISFVHSKMKKEITDL